MGARQSKTATADLDENTYPPASANPHLFGHEHIEQALADAFAGGRMHHAWLLTGPKGIGKATLAHRFARYLLAQHARPDTPPEPDAPTSLFGDDEADTPEPEPIEQGVLFTDPASTLFQRCAAGGHADLMAIGRPMDEKTGRRKTSIPVEAVRGVGHFLSMTSAEGGWRVVIVDSADELNANSANALLKVLEEPPARAILLLVSHNPGKLLPTVRSRCRRLALSPLDMPAVAALLKTYLPDTPQAELDELARLADGSPGKALALAEAGGVELWAEMNALLDGLPRLDVARLHKLADRVSRAGAEDSFETLTGLLRVAVEDVILARSGHGQPAAAWMQRMAGAASLDHWFQVWEKSNRLVARTGAVHLDRRQVVLEMFLKLESAANQPNG